MTAGSVRGTLESGQVDAFRRDGYVVFRPQVAEAAIDGVVDDLARMGGAAGAQYREGRVQDAWRLSAHIRSLAVDRSVLDALKLLYDDEPLPFQTLNFPRGTEQRPHADSIHFNSEPFGRMCGVWIALEDIGPHQGPLVYYPGSHRLPELNFPDLQISPISYANYTAYEDAIERTIAEHGFVPAYGVMKKGDALVWSANLLHGGSAQHDKRLTRLSQVTHYYFPRCRYWRPGLSPRFRAYFEPDWIPRDDRPVRNRPLHRLYYRTRAWLNRD